MGAERLPAAKVLLIQYGATMTLDQVRASFMPGLTKKAIQNRISRGDLPAMHDGVFDTQQIGDWWESLCPSAAPASKPATWTPAAQYDQVVREACASAVGVKQPTVYLLLRRGEVVYVGMSHTLFGRLSSHVFGDKDFDSVAMIHCPDGGALVLESVLIAALRPEYNIAGVPVDA